jgi:hypothetical protein
MDGRKMTTEVLEEILYALETANKCIFDYQQDIDWKRVIADKNYKNYLKSIQERNLYVMNLLENAIKEMVLVCQISPGR